jgi:glucoamylase
MFRTIVLTLLLTSVALTQTLAPGAPGRDAQWATAAKQAVGTSATSKSKVWFTLAQGVLTEIYYPDVTTANIHLFQFVVVNRKTKKIETEQNDTDQQIENFPIQRTEKLIKLPSVTSVRTINPSEFYRHYSFPSSLVYTQVNHSKTGRWSIRKTYITDPESDTVMISVTFVTKDADDELFVYYDPSLGNSGMGDTSWTDGRYLMAFDGRIASAVSCGRCTVTETNNGFLGVNDGLDQLRDAGRITNTFERAENGNVVQTARVEPVSIRSGPTTMIFAIAFGPTPEAAKSTAAKALEKGFPKIYQEYQVGWLDYLKSLPKVDPKYRAQFNTAAMVLRAHEDKLHPGANIASLSIPWGGGVNANSGDVGGYHLVWSRDLYQVATAFMALGDKAAAVRALDFLFKVQQRPDGSFPQNSWLDGRPFWGSLQLDEVAYPLILAYQLERFDDATYDHVRRAADFIVTTGPATPQERWEEEAGYSPSTIAAEIAGLVCAAEIARRRGDSKSANRWLKTADEWEANVEKWTATTTGKYGDGNYYLRITEKGRPDAGDKIELNNGGGWFDEREIVDAGFLELVRLGIRPGDHPLIVKSLKVIDQIIKVDTPNGEAFYRYNHDGYGEMDDGRRWNWDGKYTGKGRLWALLAGERGQYEIALANRSSTHSLEKSVSGVSRISGSPETPETKQSRDLLLAAAKRLDAMLAFANDGLMIPEQIWDKKDSPQVDPRFIPPLKFGEGTGSATPLAWSMAQFIRLALNLKAGRNLETPDVVYRRYVLQRGR